ncbi:MAG: hypothetical protein KC466_19665 [Myxococcales bacterium]|nr:hypothetical protein [Myxococcales bacterium]
MGLSDLLDELSEEIPDVLEALEDADPEDDDDVADARDLAETFLERYQEALEELDDQKEVMKLQRTVGLQVEKIKGLLSRLP